jgi:4-alpha-glucanotransferase
MQAAQLFGCSILPFEKVDGRFRRPTEYRKHSIASAGTHDLPTIRGYWTGADIAGRERLGLLDAEASTRANTQRRDEKRGLQEALLHAGVLSGESEPTFEQLRQAIHTFLATSTAQLFAVQLDDLLDEEAQLNVPGTVETYPNWRRKVSAGLEDARLMNALAEWALAAKKSGRA